MWQALENRLLECEQQWNAPHATRAVVGLLINSLRERYYWEIDRAQEPGRNRKAVASAQERQRKEAETLARIQREDRERLASDPCNKIEMRRRMMDAVNAMDRARYGGNGLLDLTDGRSLAANAGTTSSCLFAADWSSGRRELVTITMRKNSFGDELIEVKPF